MNDFVDNELVRAAGVCACSDNDDCQLPPIGFAPWISVNEMRTLKERTFIHSPDDDDWLEVMLKELAWGTAIIVAIVAVVLAVGQLWMKSGF